VTVITRALPSLAVVYCTNSPPLSHLSHAITFAFSLNHPAPTEIYTLSLHDALPICLIDGLKYSLEKNGFELDVVRSVRVARERLDRKSTRLNSSHVSISYAVFCLKKKKWKAFKKEERRRTVRSRLTKQQTHRDDKVP